jgi:phage major head subunit gpT-like protein
MHKSLLGAFRAAPDTHTEFAAQGDVSDFRSHNRYRPGSFGDLKALNENGEIEYTTLGDADKEQLNAEERGMIFNLTMRMLVDDDMGFFTSVARDMGRGAKRSVENDVYTHLIANGATGDGTAMFHADHGNLADTPAIISVATIGLARVAMLRQKDPGNNEFLDIVPDVLLCPIELADHARTVISSETNWDGDKNNSKKINPIRNIVRVVETPRLSGNAWYLFANAMQAPAIEVAYLNGKSEPSISTEESFSSRGISYRVTFDYGVGSVGYRSAYYNPGA